MKKILYIISILLIFTACLEKPNFNLYSVDIDFDLPNGITIDVLENATVVLSHIEKEYTAEAIVNETGVAHFGTVEPGLYRASLSFSQGSGPAAINSNGLTEIFEVVSDVSVTMPVVVSIPNPLVIKEYYYSGSLTPADNSYSSDQYVEIYNNSAVVQYADGLSIVEHESYGYSTNYWASMQDSIVVKMIWTIPGDGDDVPINPGESLVIARDAFDHKSDPNGNPLAPVDLANANFEFWVDKPGGDDIDYPSSPNMLEELYTFRGSDIVFHTRGGSAIALVFISTDATERANYINGNLVTKESAGGTSDRWYCRIHNDMVLDAVEVVWDEAHAVYKRFPIVLDAGYTYVPSGSKSGKCVRRKVEEIVDGRTVYKDTNNSTLDFEKDVDPKPWIYE